MWPVVFGSNMIIPLLFGWDLTLEHGRIGVCVAASLYLAAGWAAFYAWPSIARRLILGSIFVAVSQLVPVLHILSGVVAFSIAEAFGMTSATDTVPSEYAGFLVTFLVGGMLLTVAAVIGLVVGLFFPTRWFTLRLFETDA